MKRVHSLQSFCQLITLLRVPAVFAHFCGIFVATTFYMLLYSALKRNKPVLFPSIVLPGFISGSIWSIAQVCWFVANARLSLSIAFPLIAAGA